MATEPFPSRFMSIMISRVINAVASSLTPRRAGPRLILYSLNRLFTDRLRRSNLPPGSLRDCALRRSASLSRSLMRRNTGGGRCCCWRRRCGRRFGQRIWGRRRGSLSSVGGANLLARRSGGGNWYRLYLFGADEPDWSVRTGDIPSRVAGCKSGLSALTRTLPSGSRYAGGAVPLPPRACQFC